MGLKQILLRTLRRCIRSWWCGATLVLFLLLPLAVCPDFLLGPLRYDTALTPTLDEMEWIWVLGGGLRAPGILGYSTEERLVLAVEHYRRKPRPILVSDGSLYRHSPAIPLLRRWLEERGVTPAHVVLEGMSQTTYDNIRYSLPIFQARGVSSVLVCTSPYHQKRVAWMCRRCRGFPRFSVAPMPHSEISDCPDLGRRLRNWRLIVREYLGLAKFGFLGR